MLVIECSHGWHRSVVVAKAVSDFLYYEGYEVRIIELAMISREMAQVALDEQYRLFLGHLVVLALASTSLQAIHRKSIR